MNVNVRKLTDEELMREACNSTFNGKSGQTLFKMYRSEHSPVRTQMFWITCKNIPLFVSTHLLRHHVGSQPYALTHREDRHGGGDNGRDTLTSLSILANAQSLIDMAKVRECLQASVKTRDVFAEIKKKISTIDPDLTKFMVKKCIYRNGLCGEKCCGYNKTQKYRMEQIHYNRMF